MDSETKKRSKWLDMGTELSANGQQYNSALASWFFNIISIDTVIELDEDPSELADIIRSEFINLIPEFIDSKWIFRLNCSINTDGETIGMNLEVHPEDFTDSEFDNFINSLYELVSEFMA
jgi:hypothetical protein